MGGHETYKEEYMLISLMLFGVSLPDSRITGKHVAPIKCTV